MKSVCTIGYEHATSDAFFAALGEAKVGLVVDVRAVAASRRPGFSKRQLAAGLDAHGIGYVHLRKLGTPKEGRLAARSGHAEEMLRIYESHLDTADAKRELDELEALAKESIAAKAPGGMTKPARPICLLCYERNPAHCHRQRLASELHSRLGARIEHLFCAPVI